MAKSSPDPYFVLCCLNWIWDLVATKFYQLFWFLRTAIPDLQVVPIARGLKLNIYSGYCDFHKCAIGLNNGVVTVLILLVFLRIWRRGQNPIFGRKFCPTCSNSVSHCWIGFGPLKVELESYAFSKIMRFESAKIVLHVRIAERWWRSFKPYSQMILGRLHCSRYVTPISAPFPHHRRLLKNTIPHLEIIHLCSKHFLTIHINICDIEVDICSIWLGDNISAVFPGRVIIWIWWWGDNTSSISVVLFTICWTWNTCYTGFCAVHQLKSRPITTIVRFEPVIVSAVTDKSS